MGQLIGPPVGGWLADNYGFEDGCVYFGATQAVYAIFYFIFGINFCMLKQ